MTTTQREVTDLLAEWATGVSYADADPVVQHAARRTTLNVVALATAAARRTSVELTLDLHRRLGTPSTLSLFGREERAGTFAAPLVNAMAAHVDDYDDTHLPTIVHPGAPIVPAALAAAEARGASGAEAMTGILAGVEVALRVADGICPEHLERGWHPTGTCGHLGAAVAAARVLGLDHDGVRRALSLAASQSAGLLTINGTMTKGFHPAKAAANGYEAALLAEQGLGGPEAAIESPIGLAAATSPKIDLDRMVDDLGSRWEIERNAIKPYACGIVSHAAIDAAIALRDRVRPDQIADIRVRVPEVVVTAMGIEDPADELETKFSVYHCVAVGLVDGAGGPPQFSDERARADDVVAVRRKVQVVVDPAVPVAAVVLTITTTDGREHVEEVLHATASAERPMTDVQLEHKARGLLEPVLGREGATDVLERASTLGDADGVGDLFASTRWG